MTYSSLPSRARERCPATALVEQVATALSTDDRLPGIRITERSRNASAAATVIEPGAART